MSLVSRVVQPWAAIGTLKAGMPGSIATGGRSCADFTVGGIDRPAPVADDGDAASSTTNVDAHNTYVTQRRFIVILSSK